LSIFFVLAIKVGKVAKVHFFGDMWFYNLVGDI
jgi:hypothetical protein